MFVPDFVNHPEWYVWSKDTDKLSLIDDAPEEAKKSYQDYLDFLKYEEDNNLDF